MEAELEAMNGSHETLKRQIFSQAAPEPVLAQNLLLGCLAGG